VPTRKARIKRLMTHRRELVDPKIAEHSGRIVKTTGDGILAEFPSVLHAVRCAAELQRAMIDRKAGTPKDRRIRFRIGASPPSLVRGPPLRRDQALFLGFDEASFLSQRRAAPIGWSVFVSRDGQCRKRSC